MDISRSLPAFTRIIAKQVRFRSCSVVVVLALVLAPGLVFAQSSCLDDITGRSNNCTANDVRITAAVVSDTLDGCISPSDTATIELEAELLAGTDRYDIGIFTSVDGGDAKSGVCVHDFLSPVSAPPAHDPLSGVGDFADLDSDTCGDLVSSEATFKGLGTIEVACSDVDSDGLVELSTCTSWDNQSSNNCTGLSQAVPSNKSKCNCETQNTTISVPQISLSIDCVPRTARPGETVYCTATWTNIGIGTGDFIDLFVDYDETSGTAGNLSPPVGDSATDDGTEIAWVPGGAPATAGNIAAGTSSDSMTFEITLDGSLSDGDSIDTTLTISSFGVGQTLTDATQVNVTTTDVIVSEFDGFESELGRVVYWRTAVESGTVGFHLERWDGAEFVRVTPRTLPAVLQDQGGAYAWIDPDATAGMPTEYKLVEVMLDGGSKAYGPFVVDFSKGQKKMDQQRTLSQAGLNDVDLELLQDQGFVSRASSGRSAALRSRTTKDLRHNGGPRWNDDRGTGRVALSLASGGWHRIDAEQMAGPLGVSVSQLEAALRYGGLKLSHRGEEVAWLDLGLESGAMAFFAIEPESHTTADHVYWVDLARGTQMPMLRHPLRPPVHLEASVQIRAEEDQIALTRALVAPDSDFWFWQGVAEETSEPAIFDLQLPAVSELSHRVDLEIEGYGFPIVSRPHLVYAWMNRSFIGTTQLEAGLGTARLAIDSALLESGANQLKLLLSAPESPLGGVFYDSIALDLRRETRAVDGSFDGVFEDHGTGWIRGFESPDIMVVDVTSPMQPAFLGRTEIADEGGEWSIKFSVERGHRYVASELRALNEPVTMRASDRPEELLEAVSQSDYLVVTAPELLEGAQAIADYRSAQGYRTVTMTTVEVADAFDHGHVGPDALRRAVETLFERRGGDAAVLLVGSGTFDTFDRRAMGDNLLPPLLASTSLGLYGSDSHLADVVGADGVPDLAIGRLPATDVEQVLAYLSKVENFESSSRDWKKRTLLIADQGDVAGDFHQTSNGIASLLDPGVVDKIYLGEPYLPDDARDALVEQLNTGVGVTSYFGHAALQFLGTRAVLRSQELERLTNGRRPTVLVGFTCHVGRFDIPGFPPLSSDLVLAEGKGAAAVWTSSSLSQNGQASLLAQGFFEKLGDPALTIGQRILHAQRTFIERGGEPELLLFYNLLGDPLLEMPARD